MKKLLLVILILHMNSCAYYFVDTRIKQSQAKVVADMTVTLRQAKAEENTESYKCLQRVMPISKAVYYYVTGQKPPKEGRE